MVRQPRHAWLCLGIAGTTLACYLPYRVFDDWWYTRFLLPAIPLLIVASVATLVAIVERFAPRLQLPVTTACVAAVMTLWITTARARHAFDLSDLEQHYHRAGTAAAAHVPATASIFTVKNSGSVQYHAGLPTVSWDTLEPDALDRTLAFVRERGYPPYLLLEIDEEQAFRERFRGTSVLGNLDWPPRVQVGRTIRLYDPLDRARFLEDGKVRTEFVREAPVPRRDWRRWFATR